MNDSSPNKIKNLHKKQTNGDIVIIGDQTKISTVERSLRRS
ncbi:hypothetical protein [Bacillus thuringiensis]|nr:hypothetical protein [Bacillus thuringiensis]